jgi:hypothetical protein
MGHRGFDESVDAPKASDDIAGDQLATSGETRNKPKKSKTNQEWGRDIVANGYLMILYQ